MRPSRPRGLFSKLISHQRVPSVPCPTLMTLGTRACTDLCSSPLDLICLSANPLTPPAWPGRPPPGRATSLLHQREENRAVLARPASAWDVGDGSWVFPALRPLCYCPACIHSGIKLAPSSQPSFSRRNSTTRQRRTRPSCGCARCFQPQLSACDRLAALDNAGQPGPGALRMRCLSLSFFL